MKKNYHLMILAAALALCAVSCGKEEPATPDQPVIDNGEGNEDNNGSATPGGDVTLVPYSFTVDGTKTYIDGSKVAWEEGESIAVYDGTAIREFTMASAEGPVFSGVIADNATYAWAVYPYASEGISATETSVTAAIPSGQTLSGQNAAKGALLTAGKIDLNNNTVTLLNLHGLVSVTIGHDDIAEVSVSGAGLAGTVTFSFDATGALSQATPTSVTSSVDKVTLTPDGETFTKGITYYVAALPGAKISSVSVKRTDGFEASKKVTGEKTLTRNAGFAAGTLDDTALDWVYNVSSADELMAWAEVNSGTWKDVNGVDATWAAAFITDTTTRYANATSHTVKLTDNIDMSGKTWTPQTLYCNFDGGNHSITKIVVEQANNSTFFQSLNGSASVKDVTFGASGDGSAFTVTSIASGQKDVYAAPIGQTNGSSSVENVTNYAAVSFAAECGLLANQGNYLAGGIVGSHSSTGSVSSCKNYGDVSNLAADSQKSTSLYNYVNVGGVCGRVTAGPGSVTSCENYADVLYQSSTSPSTANVGGVIGVNNVASTISDCNNSGTVTIDNSSTVSFNANIGGIAGYVQSNAATLTRCNNLTGGNVTISGKKTGITAIGGVVGRNSSAAATYSSCTNAAMVSVTYTGTGNPYVGGFIGYVASTNAPSFSGCSNSGAVKIAHTSSGTSSAYAGGFAGRIETASTEFSSCDNSGEITFASSISGNTWSHIGGFVGELYANDIKLSSCTSKGNITSTANIVTASNHVLRLGGIVGVSENGNCSGMTVDGCTAEGITISCDAAQNVGGIVGYVSSKTFSATNNTIKNVTLSTTGTVSNAAILVGNETQASTLTGNKVSGSVLGTALTADNYTSYLYKGTAPTLSDNTFISE